MCRRGGLRFLIEVLYEKTLACKLRRRDFRAFSLLRLGRKDRDNTFRDDAARQHRHDGPDDARHHAGSGNDPGSRELIPDCFWARGALTVPRAATGVFPARGDQHFAPA